MLSKIIAGLLAAAVLSVGGYAYWQYSSDSSEPCCETIGNCPSDTATVPPCCQEPSRTNVSSKPCCCCEGEEATPEVLAVQPRELK